MFLIQVVILIFSSVLLTACASPGGSTTAERDLTKTGSDCISIRTIRDYTPLDRSSLLVEGAGGRMYYVTLVVSSFELRSSHRIGVQSRDSWLCPYGGDRLTFGGFDEYGASIRGIMRLTPEQADDLLIRHGRKQPPEQQDPTPPDLDGAEVEELGEIG